MILIDLFGDTTIYYETAVIVFVHDTFGTESTSFVRRLDWFLNSDF